MMQPAMNNNGIVSDPLEERAECNKLLSRDPHNPAHHLHRGQHHSKLGFPDLAAADAYRALTLLEAVVDPTSSEYETRKRVGLLDSTGTSGHGDNNASTGEKLAALNTSDADGAFEPITYKEYEANIGDAYALLVHSLIQCGCMRDAYDFCVQALGSPDVGRTAQFGLLEKLLCRIKRYAVKKSGENTSDQENFSPIRLEAQGLARRVVYPWNTHEPDRNSPETVKFLNRRLQTVAPKCEVRAVALPSLHDPEKEAAGPTTQDEQVSIQLGLFAKEHIAPGETLLHESSLLTATNRVHDDLCDACNGRLPEISAPKPPVPCEECADTVFCSQECHDTAQEIYHGAVCGQEGLETIGKDIQDPKDRADYLYLLLLGRAIAMAATQGVHPLELPEIKYIWGGFYELESDLPKPTTADDPPLLPPSATLPFSFQLSILQPMRILEEMGIDPFASLHLYDTWIFNTMYAKFRGTASGRLSTWDGGPEVCAVHPLWCLANHSCDPNVRWEWGGEITFVARSLEEKVQWGPQEEREKRRSSGGGVKKDEEILNHYCDLGLVVKKRREWAMGALGGDCQCPRCVWEASQEST